MQDCTKIALIRLTAFSAWLALIACPALGQGFRMSDRPARILKAGNENHAIAFSPDSRYMAAGGSGMFSGSTIILFEMPGGNQVHVLQGHSNHVNGLAFSPDGKRLISGSNDHTIRIWDVASGGEVGRMQDRQEIRGMGCAGDGKLVAAGGTGKVVTLWDATTLSSRGQLQQHSDRIEAVAMSPDGRFVASGGTDKTATIWDLERGGVLTTLAGHGDQVTAVAFSPDNTRFATGCEDEIVRQWLLPDFTGGSALAGHENDVLSVAYSPDGRYLASGSRDHTVIVWDAKTGQLLHKKPIGQDPWSLAFSPDGTVLAVGTSDKGVFLFGLEGIGSPILYAKKPTGPSIELLKPDSSKLDTSTPKIIITGLVSDPEGITRVSVNGLDAQLAEPMPEEVEKFGRDYKVYRFIGEALLVLGENKIQIMAMDAKGNVNEKMIVVNRLIGTVDADGTQRLTHTSTIARTEPVGDKVKIAVLDLDAQGVTPVVAQVLSESVRTELYNSGRFRVMNREDVDKVLKEKAFEMTSAFESNAKIAEMGTALGVEKIVTGSIGKLGETYAVTLRVINVASHENERIVTERYRGTEDGLFMTVEVTARRLTAGY